MYCLTQKISSTLASGAAITINANNVVLDLNGYAIGNLAAGASTAAVGIYAVDRQNIVVKNGILRGFWMGIGLVDGTTVGLSTALSSGHVIDGITTDTCYLAGMDVEGPYAVVRNSKVMNTQGSAVATSTGLVDLAMGISVYGADTHVVDNTVINTDCTNGCASTLANPATVIGISVSDSSSSVIENNTISNAKATTVGNLGNGAASVAIAVYQLAGFAPAVNVFVINNQMINWDYGIYYIPAGTGTANATGDFLMNGTQTVTFPYTGGTNINLGSGMNF